MPNFALLNNVDHQDVKIVTDRSAAYGDNVMYSPTFPFEFRSVQAYYPILFHKEADGELCPVALYGFQANENLFLDENGWNANYVPAMVKREPFLIGYQESKASASAEKTRVLSLDMDHPRVNKETGEALFQPLGGRTPFLDEVANMLEAIYEGYVQSKAFVAALQEHKLIESVNFDIALEDGSRNQLLGFYAIDEDKIPGLSAEVLKDLSDKGFLMPLFMVLASTPNIRLLVDLKNKQVTA